PCLHHLLRWLLLRPFAERHGTYTVILDKDGALCERADFELRGEPGNPCKHIIAARLWRDRQARGVEQNKSNVEPSPEPKRNTENSLILLRARCRIKGFSTKIGVPLNYATHSNSQSG